MNELMKIGDLKTQQIAVKECLREAMIEGMDFGKPYPSATKPCLLKPGAEKLCRIFNLAASFKIESRFYDGGHREVQVTCSLVTRGDGILMGEGIGMASTMETKWKRGNLADSYNTVLKMAKKRAFVDATLTVTGASDIFTQDIIDEETHDFSNSKPTKSQTIPTEKTPFDDNYQATEKVISGSVGNGNDEINEKHRPWHDLFKEFIPSITIPEFKNLLGTLNKMAKNEGIELSEFRQTYPPSEFQAMVLGIYENFLEGKK